MAFIDTIPDSDINEALSLKKSGSDRRLGRGHRQLEGAARPISLSVLSGKLRGQPAVHFRQTRGAHLGRVADARNRQDILLAGIRRARGVFANALSVSIVFRSVLVLTSRGTNSCAELTSSILANRPSARWRNPAPPPGGARQRC